MALPLADHVLAVRACRRCATVVGPAVIGDAVPGARLMIVGQAPGPREAGKGRSFAHTAGQRLFAWLGGLGVSEERVRERVWISAVIRCFPGRAAGGGDRVPSRDEIAACEPHLELEMRTLRPLTVLAVGTLAIDRFLGPGPLADRVGQSYYVERWGLRFEVVPLPHPSGRSTWTNRPENRQRLEQALERVRASAGWRATFAAAAD